jgi:hypothetical protein
VLQQPLSPLKNSRPSWFSSNSAGATLALLRALGYFTRRKMGISSMVSGIWVCFITRNTSPPKIKQTKPPKPTGRSFLQRKLRAPSYWGCCCVIALPITPRHICICMIPIALVINPSQPPLKLYLPAGPRAELRDQAATNVSVKMLACR